MEAGGKMKDELNVAISDKSKRSSDSGKLLVHDEEGVTWRRAFAGEVALRSWI